MSEAFSIRVEGLEDISRMFDPKKIEKATKDAMNTMIKSTKTEVSRVARKEIGWKLPKKDFDARLDVRLVRSTAQAAVLSAKRQGGVGNRRDSFPLTKFGPKEVRKSSSGVLVRRRVKGELISRRQKRTTAQGGVSVRVLRRGPTTRWPNAFIARTSAGHIGVFRRLPGQTTSTGKDKIREIKTVSVVKIFDTIHPELVKFVKENWDRVYVGRLRRFYPDVKL